MRNVYFTRRVLYDYDYIYMYIRGEVERPRCSYAKILTCFSPVSFAGQTEEKKKPVILKDSISELNKHSQSYFPQLRKLFVARRI